MSSTDIAEKIAEAAICVIATHGLARLTHRAVASAAEVSLAATTRHFATKADIVAAGSDRLLKGYLAAFSRAVERQRHGQGLASDMRSLLRLLTANAAGYRQRDSLAWCEIMLAAGRTARGQVLARHWFDELSKTWADLAEAMGSSSDPNLIESAIDTAIGLLFIVLPLALTPDQVRDCLRHGFSPDMVRISPADTLPLLPVRATSKARETKERIIDAAIGIMVDGGPELLTYNAISARAGLTLAAPAYHFGTIDRLIAVAQDRMFSISQDRYREILRALPASPRDLDELVDLTAAIFARESTEFVAINRATYSIWLEAARSPALRESIRRSAAIMQRAWAARLYRIGGRSGDLEGLGALALYIGKFVRIAATGSRTVDLARMHHGFKFAMSQLSRPEPTGTFF